MGDVLYFRVTSGKGFTVDTEFVGPNGKNKKEKTK